MGKQTFYRIFYENLIGTHLVKTLAVIGLIKVRRTLFLINTQIGTSTLIISPIGGKYLGAK